MTYDYNPYTNRLDLTKKEALAFNDLSDMPGGNITVGDATITNLDLTGSLSLPYENLVVIAKSGGEFTTIQAALNASPTASTLFLIYPGTYTNDTINFTANNQCVIGAGLTPQQIVTNTAQISNFGAYTGCRLNNIKLEGTYTSDIDMITGSGQLIARDVHLKSTISGTIAGSPTIVNTTGTFKQVRGTIEYTNNASSAGQIKQAITLGSGATAELRRVTVDIGGSGSSAAITLGYGSGTGELDLYRCKVDVEDLEATIVNGLAYLGGSGDNEYMGNDIHVTCGGVGKNAYGFLCTSATSLTIRGMFNHLHILDNGGSSYGMSIGANCTVTSQFDDIIAADGNQVTGTLVQANSESDGNLNISGTVSTSSVTTTDIAGTNATFSYVDITDIDGVNATFSNVTVSGEIKGGGYVTAFESANLAAGVYTISHNLDVTYPIIQIYNNSEKQVTPDDITYVSISSCTVDLSSWGAISGTWHATVMGGA